MPPAEILIARSSIAARVRALASALSTAYASTAQPPVLISVLQGSALFTADLMRSIAIDMAVDFISISSYAHSGSHSGVVKIVKDVEIDLSDRDVVIVEDIVDTGLTLNYLRRSLTERGPHSLRTITLLDKTVRRLVPVPVEFVGFEIPDVFVVGYGLDFQGRYRNVGDILVVRDLARLVNEPDLLVGSLWPRRGQRRQPT
ncbi:MAG: hypoxanthine phosphoribosyltransferase [Actinobacteria bacterium]|nr:hypoxanthine phosphoribosyltransferase [Actinomycetota bacterium]